MENSNAQIFKVKNAGIVLTAPFLPIFFYRLGYLVDSRREFIDKEKPIRGIFLLQYLATYSLEVKDSELVLFKIMLNYPLSDPLPCNIELTSKETSLIDELLNSLKINWSKMKNVSNRGFQETFLRREGVLKDMSDYWNLKMEDKPYDVLLDSVPWSYSMVKYPFQEKLIRVNWRN